MAIPLPDRFKKKPLMPAPGAKKGVTVAIGITKPKPGEDDPDKGADPLADDDAAPAMPPPGAGGAPGAEPAADDQGDVMTPDQAIVLRVDDKTCQSCKHWGPTDGSCEIVPEAAPLDGGDRCLRGYEPTGGNEANDADTSGDSDAGAGAPPMPPGGAGAGQ